MLPAGFEPAIPASERPQTHALDRAATGIGTSASYKCIIYNIFTGNNPKMLTFKETDGHLYYGAKTGNTVNIT